MGTLLSLLLEAANRPVSLAGLPTTALELASFVLSVITVALNIRQNHWAWLFAIVSSAAYGLVFFGSRLYGDMGLQLVFIAVSIWGWRQWLRGGGSHDSLPVTWATGRQRAGAVAGWLLGFALLAWFLQRWTDTDVPGTDGFLTAGSLAGQVLLSRKKVENWHVWIFVDVIYVGLYLHKNLLLTAILYGVFVLMAVAGMRAWARAAADGGGEGGGGHKPGLPEQPEAAPRMVLE
jgi:nicotinamide mononucleotide transporter